MTDAQLVEANDKISRLEEQVQRKDDEIKAKEKSFAEALEREQVKHKEREAKDSAKRDDLNSRVLQLTDEKGKIASELDSLKEQEEEFKKNDAQLKTLKKENGQLRVNHAEERQNLLEQRDDKRRQADKAQQELADLRCQLSILDHKYQHVMTKQTQQDSQAEEMKTATVSMKALQEQLEDTEREQQTEAARFSRDRKVMEDRIAKLQQELAHEREGLSKVELTSKYQSIINSKNTLLSRSLYCSARTGGPLVPRDVEDEDAVQNYLQRLEKFIEEQNLEDDFSESVSARRRRGGNNSGANSPARGGGEREHSQKSSPTVSSDWKSRGFGASISQQLDDFILGLERIPEERQNSLLRRFNDSLSANVANSRRFVERSGFPTHKEDPLVLVNHIANLTAERDALLIKVKERYNISEGPSRTASMRKQASPDADRPSTADQQGGSQSPSGKRIVNSASPGGRSRSPVTGRRMWK